MCLRQKCREARLASCPPTWKGQVDESVPEWRQDQGRRGVRKAGGCGAARKWTSSEGGTQVPSAAEKARKARAEARHWVPHSAGPGGSSWGAGRRLTAAAATWQWVEM